MIKHLSRSALLLAGLLALGAVAPSAHAALAKAALESSMTLPAPAAGVTYNLGAAAVLQPMINGATFHVPASQDGYNALTRTLTYDIGPAADRYVWTQDVETRSRGNSTAIDIVNASAIAFTATITGSWTYDLLVSGCGPDGYAWVEGQIKGSPDVGELPFFRIQTGDGAKSGIVNYSFNITVPAGGTESIWIDPTAQVAAVPEPSTCLAGLGAALLLLRSIIRRNRA